MITTSKVPVSVPTKQVSLRIVEIVTGVSNVKLCILRDPIDDYPEEFSFVKK